MRANEEQGGNAVQRQYGGFVAEGIGQVPRTQLSVPRYLFAVVGHDPTSGGLRSFPLSSHYLSISASHSPSPSPVLFPFSLPSASHSPFPTFTIFIFCSLSPSPAAYSPSPATCSPSSALSRWYSSFLSPVFTLHLLFSHTHSPSSSPFLSVNGPALFLSSLQLITIFISLLSFYLFLCQSLYLSPSLSLNLSPLFSLILSLSDLRRSLLIVLPLHLYYSVPIFFSLYPAFLSL